MDKRRLIVLLLGLLFIILSNRIFAISNPSAVYCESLGYKYEISSTESGDVGICVISPYIKLDAWDFFEGKIGQQYSYCAINGYPTQTLDDGKNAFSEEYAACVTSGKSVSDLMNFSERLISDKFPSEEKPRFSFFQSLINQVTAVIVRTFTGRAVGGFTVAPLEFDWRNYNGNWLTSVKNQGSCGSCWAFATLGNMESKIKIARDDSGFDIDLSEQDMVSCGVPYGFYDGYGGGCVGATLEDPLAYLNSSGVTDEACFSYTADDISCSLKCSSSGKRIWKIDSYDYTPLTREEIKEYLVAKGPIIAGIYMAGSFVDGIYTCSNPGDNLNHAVVIVGYNDTGKYWIVKNSWGSNWNGNGYFYVGYGECNIETYTMFTELEINSTEKTNIINSEIVLGREEGDYDYLSLKDNLSMTYREICNSSNCTGYDVRDIFSLRNQTLSFLDLITYQNSSNEKETSFYYWNNQKASWENLGGIAKNNYLIRYSLCNSSANCLQYFSDGNVVLRYSHLPLQNSSVDFSSVDLLYLETKATECNDSWVLNETWTACDKNDMQYKKYYDLNRCYKNSSYLHMNISQQCDYCISNISQRNESCTISDTRVSWYNDSNSCFSKTGLNSDRVPNNQTAFCDYCFPNWTENRICNSNDSLAIWYNDSNSCFLKTNLSSDLAGKPNNQTLASCNSTSNNPTNNSNNITVFCGDTICNGEETCSSCSSDCGACPQPEQPAASSGGGGGGGGGGGSYVSSQSVTETETGNADDINSNNQISEENSVTENGVVSAGETSSKTKKSFSLTGLMVAVQNSTPLKIILLLVIVVGIAILIVLIKKNKFSTRKLHKNIVKIHRRK